MQGKTFPIVNEEFVLGFRPQSEWGWKIAIAFFFGELGSGLFFVSAFYDFTLGMAIGWVLVSVCKPAALFMHLGHPERAWRAIMGLGHSWISRGLLASVLFTGFGGAHIINLHYGIVTGGLAQLLMIVAMVSCVVVMIYLGFVLSYSPSISLWGSGIMPVISLTYALLGGVTLVLIFGYHTLLADNPQLLSTLKSLELGLVLLCGVIMLSFLHGAAYASEAGKASVALLLKHDFAKWFVPFVLLVGIAVTALLAYMGPTSFTAILAVAVAELIGDFALKILLFKAGLYEPAIGHSRF
ncbi:nitrite reductase [Desulfocarbo indianensis]|nr:nitrite reductase [Desulfocarbo indianensis]